MFEQCKAKYSSISSYSFPQLLWSSSFLLIKSTHFEHIISGLGSSILSQFPKVFKFFPLQKEKYRCNGMRGTSASLKRKQCAFAFAPSIPLRYHLYSCLLNFLHAKNLLMTMMFIPMITSTHTHHSTIYLTHSAGPSNPPSH